MTVYAKYIHILRKAETYNFFFYLEEEWVHEDPGEICFKNITLNTEIRNQQIEFSYYEDLNEN